MIEHQPDRWPTSKLVPYARNARTHSDDQVAEIVGSIEKFGFTNPILVSDAGDVIAGHGRLAAATKLGLDEVPVIVIKGLSETARRELTLADNRIALNAGWDAEKLSAELSALSDVGSDLRSLGFSGEELDKFLSGGGKTDPNDAPPVPKQAISRPGDLWLLGDHRLLCGDSTSGEDVSRLLAGAAPNLMVTDPPYGVSYDPSWRNAALGPAGRATGRVQNDDKADWREAWALFPGSVAYVWHGGLHGAEVEASLKAVGFKIRAQIIWVKTQPVVSRGHYNWQHEPAFYAVGEGGDDWRFVPEHEVAGYAVEDGATADWHGDKKQASVWFIEHLKSKTGHGTQKPVECMRRPMVNNSGRGDAVYDPFSGSGTSIIAAQMCDRRCFAMELDPAYVDVGVQRWQEFVGAEAVLEGDGRSFASVAAERAQEAAHA